MGSATAVLLWVLFMFCSVRINEILGVEIVNEQAMKLLFLGSGGLLILWRASVFWLMLRSLNPYILMFLALGWCSFVWSIEPKLTFLRMLTLSCYVVVITAFVCYDWTRERFQRVVRSILLTIVLMSFVAWLVQPSLVIEVGEDISLKDSWKGVSLQKNMFGQIAAFSTALWWHALLTRESRIWMARFGLFASAYGLILSRSSTALMAGALACAFIWLLLRSPPNMKRYLPFISGAFAVLVVTYSMAVLQVVPGLDLMLKPITALTGKDQTFSGRSLIWDVIKQHIAFAPVLGTGFGAYWAGPQYTWSPSWDVARVMYIYPYQSHNGYLEVINDLGYVGLLVLVGYIVTFMRQSLILFRADRAQGAIFLSLFFMTAISNLSQSIWFTSNIEFVIMIVATFALGRSVAELKLKAGYAAQQLAANRVWRPPFAR